MQGNLSDLGNLTHTSSVSLGRNHGYRFDGDTAILNAELSLSSSQDQTASAQHWALQLWACETPYEGGPLRGLKVAEAELALPELTSDSEQRLETEAFARLPAHGEYAMVLVLASGDRGRYDQVHDFSNYPSRQQFAGPSLEGSVGYRFEGDSVVLQASAVRNSRSSDNLSGTLALELWALEQPYTGGWLQGSLLAHASLGRLEGQAELAFVEQRVALDQPPEGEWQIALLLREWTYAAGYVTRDFCNFAATHRVTAAHAEAWREGPQHEEPAAFGSLDAPYGLDAQPAPETQPVAESTPALEATASAELQPARETQPESELQPARATQPESELPPARATQPESELQPARATQPESESKPVVAASPARELPTRAAVDTRPAAAKPLTTQAPNALKAKPSVPVAAPFKTVAAVAPVAAAPSNPGARVSVQTASVDELASVAGLNKKLAQAIVKARPFHALEDVVRVRGIGDKMLQRLRDQLTL